MPLDRMSRPRAHHRKHAVNLFDLPEKCQALICRFCALSDLKSLALSSSQGYVMAIDRLSTSIRAKYTALHPLYHVDGYGFSSITGPFGAHLIQNKLSIRSARIDCRCAHICTVLNYLKYANLVQHLTLDCDFGSADANSIATHIAGFIPTSLRTLNLTYISRCPTQNQSCGAFLKALPAQIIKNLVSLRIDIDTCTPHTVTLPHFINLKSLEIGRSIGLFETKKLARWFEPLRSLHMLTYLTELSTPAMGIFIQALPDNVRELDLTLSASYLTHAHPDFVFMPKIIARSKMLDRLTLRLHSRGDFCAIQSTQLIELADQLDHFPITALVFSFDIDESRIEVFNGQAQSDVSVRVDAEFRKAFALASALKKSHAAMTDISFRLMCHPPVERKVACDVEKAHAAIIRRFDRSGLRLNTTIEIEDVFSHRLHVVDKFSSAWNLADKIFEGEAV